MTVSTTVVRNTYAGNGAAVDFSFTFSVLRAADLIVTTTVDDTGVETVLVLDTDYTITEPSRFPKTAGGTITLTAAAALGTTVLIQRSVDLLQDTDYKNQGRFYAETHERSFDRATMQIQQIADAQDRSIQQPAAGLPWYDAQNNRIINVADAEDAQDAVNLRVLEEAISDAVGAIGGYVIPTTWVFTGDGTTLAFAIPDAPVSAAAAYEVSIDGLRQSPGVDYTIQLGVETITFSPAPPNGAYILVLARGYSAPISDVEWDAEGETIVNVGDPVNPGDAINLGWLDAALALKSNTGHTHAASDIVSGYIDPDRLGTGVRDGTRLLRDDGVWVDLTASLGLPTVARGDLFVYNGTTVERLPIGENTDVLIADDGETLGLRWGYHAPDASAVQVIVQTTMLVDSSTIDLEVNGLGFSAGVIAESISTGHLASEAVTGAKIAGGTITDFNLATNSVGSDQVQALSITADKLNTAGTPSSTTFLNGDFEWIEVGATHTHAAADIVSGIFSRERLGAGYGSIPAPDRPNYFLNADGSWVSLTVDYDGNIVSGGSGEGGGGTVTAEYILDVVGGAAVASATVAPTYNDGGDTLSWAVVAGSIGLAQISTASLDTRYALVGTGTLPSGGSTATMLRGDGAWSSTVVGDWTVQGDLYVNGDIVGVGTTQFVNTPTGVAYPLSKTAHFSGVGSDPYVRWSVAPAAGAGAERFVTLTYQNSDSSYRFRVGDSGSPVKFYATGDAAFSAGMSVGGAVLMANTLQVTGPITGPIAASNISSGVIAPARLGSGTPSAANYLRGDGAWVTIATAGAVTVSDTATINLALDGLNDITGTIVDASVSTAKLANAAVTTTKIADANVTTAKIADANVTTAKIVDANITTAKIADQAVTSAKLGNGAVTSIKITAGAVTPSKLQAISGTPDATTFYRGDGTWQTVGAAGSTFYNVKTYGATGDGITDDRLAIQTALNAASAAGGGTVYFPAGTYVVTTGLNIGNRTTVLGDGPHAVTIDATTFDASGSVFIANGHDFAAVKALRIEYNPADTGTYTYGVLMYHCTQAVLEDVEVDGIFGAGLSFNGCDRAWAHRCNATNGGLDSLGYFVADSAELAQFIDCCASYNGLGGIIGGSNIRVQGGFWHHNGINESGSALGGASLYFATGTVGGEIPVTNLTIDGVTAHSDTEEAIQIFGDGCSVTNCISYNNDGGGIAVFGSNDCVIANNVCFNNGNIRATGTGYGGVSQPPWFWAGIKMIDSTDCVVSGNRCYDDRVTKYQSYGLGCAPASPVYYFGGTTTPCDNIRVVGNLFTGNDSGEVTQGGATNFNTTTW